MEVQFFPWLGTRGWIAKEIALDNFDGLLEAPKKMGIFRYPSSGQPSSDNLDKKGAASLIFGGSIEMGLWA